MSVSTVLKCCEMLNVSVYCVKMLCDAKCQCLLCINAVRCLMSVSTVLKCCAMLNVSVYCVKMLCDAKCQCILC